MIDSPDLVLVQTVKWQVAGLSIGIRVCHLLGNWFQITCLLPKDQVVSTAYIERINATFRQRLAGLCRRTRCLLRSETTLSVGVYLVGTVYNFCTPHKSLRQEGQERSPAMAAGITATLGNVGELLSYHVAPPPYVAPKRRGRKPKETRAETPKASVSSCHRIMGRYPFPWLRQSNCDLADYLSGNWRIICPQTITLRIQCSAS